jgi:hypothetical protein
MVKNKTKKTEKTKKSKYPMRSKKEITFKGRSGYPMLHEDKPTGRIFIMTRKKSGGVERTYLSKSLNVPKELKKHPSEKRLKTKNPTKAKPKTTPKRKKAPKKKEDNSLLYIAGAGLVGLLGYSLIKKGSGSSGRNFVVNSYNKLKKGMI